MISSPSLYSLQIADKFCCLVCDRWCANIKSANLTKLRVLLLFINFRISESSVKEETVMKQESDETEENQSEIEIKKSIDLDISFKDVNDLLLSLTHIRQIIEDGSNIIVSAHPWTPSVHMKVMHT